MRVQSYVTYDKVPGYTDYYKKVLVTIFLDKYENYETLQKYLDRYKTDSYLLVTGNI